ncbi:MAG TPA: ABC transporter permease [Chthoniobacterales bacterium]
MSTVSTPPPDHATNPTGASRPSDSPAWNPGHITHALDRVGLNYFSPFVRLAARDEPGKQMQEILRNTLLPIIAFGIFLGFWAACADRIHTDSMRIPTPAETWQAWQGIVEFARHEKQNATAFHERMEVLAAKQEAFARQAESDLSAAKASSNSAQAEILSARIASCHQHAEEFRHHIYVGPPTFFDQVRVSLFTVTIGFLAATIIAVPLGILCGLSKTFNTAINPIIQIFKPVSPLAWLPIVFVVVTALYDPPANETLFTRALLISAGTVTLCSLWPTLINTALGVASIDPDHMNVARVLKLNWLQRIFKVVLPSALPLIFTGLRLSLGVGWMVLIAADMLAQNPGLGKFVWDTFQNGSTTSMAQIVCAVFAIGLIGFALDRVMLILQRLVSFDENAA